MVGANFSLATLCIDVRVSRNDVGIEAIRILSEMLKDIDRPQVIERRHSKSSACSLEDPTSTCTAK